MSQQLTTADYEEAAARCAAFEAEMELASEAVEESAAAGKLFTICQSCTWPIQYGDHCWYSAAAEGHICRSCHDQREREAGK